MNLFGDFHFLRPWWLLLLPLGILLWRLKGRALDPLRAWRAVMAPDLLEALTVGAESRIRWRAVPLLLGWVIGAIAVAGPTWRPEASPFSDDPVPVMLVLKAGETMMATDLAPSRMERARLKVADFAAERNGLPLGLLAYAGSAHLVLPPTRDTGIVATMAAEISPAIMPRPGDDLAGALALAARTLGDAGGVIVVLADTIPSHHADALRDFRATSRIPVHILAVAHTGTPEWEAIAKAASALNARVTPLTPDSSDVASLVRRSANAPVAVALQGEGIRWAEAGWWLVPLLAALMLTQFRREGPFQPEEVAS
jgi:Ca-activated chloride channel family protein